MEITYKITLCIYFLKLKESRFIRKLHKLQTQSPGVFSDQSPTPKSEKNKIIKKH